MIPENRDLHQVLRALVQSARMLPDADTGAIVVILDMATYMNIEDYVAAIARRESPHDAVPEPTLFGEPPR